MLWKHGVLTIGQLGKYLDFFLINEKVRQHVTHILAWQLPLSSKHSPICYHPPKPNMDN